MTVFISTSWLRSLLTVSIAFVVAMAGGREGDRRVFAYEEPYLQPPHTVGELWRDPSAAHAAGSQNYETSCSMPKNQYLQRDWDNDIPRLPVGDYGFNANLSAGYLERGNACLRHGSKLEAIVAYTYAIRFNPGNTDAYANRGTAYAMWSRHRNALNDYTQALQLNPNEAALYVMRAQTYALAGDREHALQDYTQALKMDRNNAAIYHQRGVTYATLGRYDLAIHDYKQALAINPTLGEACRALSNAYRQFQAHDQARAIWDRCPPSPANSIGSVTRTNGVTCIRIASFTFPIKE